MDDNKSITFSNNSQVTRAKSFKINSPTQNYSQYINTVKAYAQAGLPFEHIANAGDHLGDSVERGEIDASIHQGWQNKAGEIAEDKSKILAWQNRGETISITQALGAPTSNSLTTSQQTREQTLNVVEGISVTKVQPSELDNNPFLKAPANLK